MRVFSVYLLICKANGKVYVGQTTKNPTERFKEHVRAANRGDQHMPICRAIRKRGAASFDVQPLAIVSNLAEADNLERVWIILLRSNVPQYGYNAAAGGIAGTMLGRKHTEQTKRKISQSHIGIGKGERRSPRTEFRAGHCSFCHPKGITPPWLKPLPKGNIPWIKGRKHTAESKQKMRAAKLGIPRYNLRGELHWSRRDPGRCRSVTRDGGLLGAHVRWHVSLGKSSSACRFCNPVVEVNSCPST